MTEREIPSSPYALGIQGGEAPGFDLDGVRALVFDPGQDPRCDDLVAVYPVQKEGREA